MGGKHDQPSRRTLKIASRLKFLISHIILRDLKDPRIGLITVLDVKPTEDLKEAKIYVSVFGTAADRSKAQQALEQSRGFIQRELGKNLETRNTPVLRFVFSDIDDRDSLDKLSRIEALIQESKAKGPRDQNGEETSKED